VESRDSHRAIASRPDIIIKIKMEKGCVLLDAVTQADRNIAQKEAEKKVK